jgi:CheY-like chemotaxis protein
MKTVLVVDDEPSVADALVAALRGAGYMAIAAYEGAQATRLLAEERIDVVVADLVMPGMDGASLLRWIRETPGMRGLPVILMSMLSEERVWALCSEYSRFLQKPFAMPMLFEAIEDVTRPTPSSGPARSVRRFVH